MNLKKLFSFWILVFLVAGAITYALTGCTPIVYCKTLFPQLTQTTYVVNATSFTPSGIRYDPSGLPINPELIDRLTDEVENCLMKAYPTGDITAMYQQPDGLACGMTTPKHFTLPVNRGCLTVKIAADWHLSTAEFAGSKQQLLHDVASNTGDCGKGENGPGACFWRAGVQDKVTIVTTPSMFVYKDPLVRIITGCAYPWSSPTMAACMTPTTTALSDGTGP